MIVVDASAAVSGLLNNGPARELLREHAIHVPHLIDSEIASAIRRRTLGGRISRVAGWRTLKVWQELAIVRYPLHSLLERNWDLRDNFSAYDAGYIAHAVDLDYTLNTADNCLTGAHT